MATYTVGSSGANYTTVAAALAVTTAADTIMLITDVDAGAAVTAVSGSGGSGVGGIMDFAELTTDGPVRKMTGTSTIFRFLGGGTGVTSISNIYFQEGNGSSDVVKLDFAADTTLKVTFTNCKFEQSRDQAISGDDTLFEDNWGAQPYSERVTFNRCHFLFHYWSDNYYGITINNTAEAGCIVKNCLFTNHLKTQNSTCITGFASSANKVVHVLNCTFFNIASNNTCIGLEGFDTCDYKIENCLFLGTSKIEIGITGNTNFTKADVKNCYFTTQTDDGGWDASNKFGAVAATEVTDPTPETTNVASLYDPDMSLIENAVSIDAGLTIVSVTDDYIGTSRPQGSAYDIGAYEYIPAPSLVYPYEEVLVEKESNTSVNVWAGMAGLQTGVIVYYGDSPNPTASSVEATYVTQGDNGRQWYKATFTPPVVSGFYFRGVGGGSGSFVDQLANIPFVAPTETPAYTTANISWEIPNVATSGDVHYGTATQTFSPVYANYSDSVIGSASGITQSAQLTGLVKDATSYYSIVSSSLDYQFAYIYANDSFVTLADPLGYLSGWPTNLTALSQSCCVKLSWGAPSYRYASGLNSGYRVYRAYTNDEIMNPIGCTYDTTYIDSGVELNRQYFYRVTTVFGDI